MAAGTVGEPLSYALPFPRFPGIETTTIATAASQASKRESSLGVPLGPPRQLRRVASVGYGWTLGRGGITLLKVSSGP